jgi:hypothetical protein
MNDSSKQNGRCISVPSANIFSNYFSNPQNNSSSNSPLAHRHHNKHVNTTTNVFNQPGAKNRLLINE